jgi:hypothetical protein
MLPANHPAGLRLRHQILLDGVVSDRALLADLTNALEGHPTATSKAQILKEAHERLAKRFVGETGYGDWDKALPREEGHYWFWGYISGRGPHKEKARLEIVHLRILKGRCSDGSDWYCYVANGAFVDEPKKAIGLWQKMAVPDPPTDRLT